MGFVHTIIKVTSHLDYSSVCLFTSTPTHTYTLTHTHTHTQSLETYLEQWGSKYTALIAFKPTGWTYGGQSGSLASIRPHVNGPITIYGK